MKKLEVVTEKGLEAIEARITTILLIASGLIGMVITISDIFGLEYHLSERHAISALISLVGIIALSLGLERAIHQRKLSSHLEYVRKLLASQVGGRLLHGMPEIYAAAIRPVSQAQKSIRAVIYGKSPKAPESFAEAVSRRLRETKDAGNPISFEIIFGVRLDELNSDFRDGVENRLKVYSKKSVADQVQLRILDCDGRVGFDALIIDEEHAFLSFPVIHGHTDVQTSIFFENQPTLCGKLAYWFDHHLEPASKDYWKWRNGG